MECRVNLEAAAEKVCRESAVPPRIYQLPAEEGRRKLEQAQNSPVYRYPARVLSVEEHTVNWGTLPVYIVIPEGVRKPADVIFYIHGAGGALSHSCPSMLQCFGKTAGVSAGTGLSDQ